MFNHFRSEVQYRNANNFMAKILCAIDVNLAEELVKKEDIMYEEAIKYIRYVRATNRVNRRIGMGVSVEGVAPWVLDAVEKY